MPGGSDAAGGLEEVEGEFFGFRGGGGHFLGGFGGFFLVDEMCRGGMGWGYTVEERGMDEWL